VPEFEAELSRKAKFKIKICSKLKKHVDKRFLCSLNNQKLYHDTFLTEENLKVEECIREFKKLLMRVGLNEDSELTIARFIKGLSLNIANQVKLQPYLSFDNICNLIIKIDNNLRVKNLLELLALLAPKAPPRFSPPTIKLTQHLYLLKPFDKNRRITNEIHKRLEGKKWFNCHGYSYFHTKYPNQRTLAIRGRGTSSY